MFDTLTDKLTTVFNRLSNRGRLTEGDVDEALREVRLALLEADVNFRVARELIDRIKQRAVGSQVLESISPGQQVVKIVHEELTALLGHGHHGLQPSPKAPSVLLVLGLQGSGKTTTAAKLALHLRNQGHRTLLVAADLRRPAAVEQLAVLGRQLDIPVYPQDKDLQTAQGTPSAVEVARSGVARAGELGLPWAIVDTGGRLHIDDELMRELEEIKKAVSPAESILVVDAMTGQDAVNAAQEFHQRIGLTGLILSKLDGDARGGAALSIAHVTGVPVKFIGTGEKPDALEPFHPDRLASRVLGMGDVLTLIERAEEQIGEKQAKELERKIRRDTFGLDDFLEQIQQLRRMGPLSQVLEMVPGLSSIARKLPAEATDESRMKKVEAIVYSMTAKERRSPDILNGSRRRRIALGSGTTPQDVNQLLNQFGQMRKLMKRMSSGRGLKGLTGLFK
ncbi:MAG: signal recognition particle protein [Chloroflexi bacterium]|nr:signal recognition particle protein [Chloroflexota bacterium]